MAALRFVIDAEDGYTVVDGEPIPMHNGDLILTPGWTWHDHNNQHPARPMVWFDGLDVPFVRALRQAFYQDFPGNTAQPITQGVLPSSPNVYPWASMYSALKERQASAEADPFDATILEYVHPLTGGHVLPTIACFLQLLAPGQRTRAHRQTTSSVYFVARGRGSSVVGGQRLDWEERDTFVVPTWAWHEHAAAPDAEAVLFSMSDLPVLEPFGYVRTEAYPSGDGHQLAG
jgi:gentisate 1,2-dioxygenase